VRIRGKKIPTSLKESYRTCPKNPSRVDLQV